MAQGPGQSVELAEGEVRRVAGIAGETLVAAVSVQRHRHVFPGKARQVERRQSGRIGERLAVVAHQLWQHLDGVGPNDEFVMFGPELLRDQPRLRQLVEALLLEADRERLDRLGGVLGHRGHHGRGVDAAREEGPHRHVGDHPAADRPADPGADLLLDLMRRGARALARIVQAPVALGVQAPSQKVSVLAGISLRTEANTLIGAGT